MSTLDGRIVLVTGAGGGVGRGAALVCAHEGAVVVVASPRKNGEETAELIRARGGSAEWVQCDVTQRTSVDASVKHTVSRHGGLDVLVHNATSRRSSEPGRLEDADPALWEDHVSVSLRGAYYCASAASRHLRPERGRFIVMTSPAGMEGSATLPLYAIVKGALRGFVKSLAREWAPRAVNVTAVSPLAVTPALEKAYREDPALRERVAHNVPMGRVGDPEADIGPAVAFLAGDGARYITGQTLVVDGGRFMSL